MDLMACSSHLGGEAGLPSPPMAWRYTRPTTKKQSLSSAWPLPTTTATQAHWYKSVQSPLIHPLITPRSHSILPQLGIVQNQFESQGFSAHRDLWHCVLPTALHHHQLACATNDSSHVAFKVLGEPVELIFSQI